jgi:hypothetical protein
MTDLNRREFIKIAGAGTAAVATGGLGAFRLLRATNTGDTVTFRAVTGIPHAPLPAYGSYMLEGTVDLAAKTGTVRRTILAGPPESMSSVIFDELTRDMRVTGVSGTTDSFTLQTEVDEADLAPGESRSVRIHVDRAAGQVLAPLLANGEVLKLQI